MTELLAVEGLSVTFPAAPRPAVDGVALSIAAGETLGIVGESGSGKSLMALTLAGLAPSSARLAGRLRWRGERIDPARREALRGQGIGIVFQEPGGCLNPLMTVGAQIAEIPHRRAPVAALLAEVGLDPAFAARHPHTLSGGQQQRAMIAIALASDPALLIADEPTTALDASVQRQVIALLADLRRRRGMAMLFISHDLDLVAELADRIAVMHQGRIVEAAPAAELFAAPAHAHTRALLAAHRLAPRMPGATGGEVLRIRGLSVDYARRRIFGKPFRAVDRVDLVLHAGETLGLVGESGTGKSTIAKAVMGLAPATDGEIALFGQSLPSRRPPGHPRCQIVFQDSGGSLNPRLTVGRIIAEPLAIRGLPRDPARLAALMEEVALDPGMLNRHPHALSGGQRQRVNLARALALDPEILLCDEIVSALDATVQARILALLADIQRQRGLALLFISHDLAVVRAIADRVAVMHRGRLVESGPAAAILGRAAGEPAIASAVATGSAAV